MTEKMLRVFEGMPLPVDAATQVFGYMGKRRTGKTYATGVFVEELLGAHVQTVVVDQVGNWWALRVAAGGKGQGFDIPVLGGLNGDIALPPESGALVADAIIDTETSAVLDVSLFSKAQRKRFLADFGERLWSRKKAQRNPAPLHIVLEECQLVVPQFVGKDDTRMVGIWEEIIRLGGNFGIGVSLLSQRPQSVNKEALTQAEVVVVFQTNGTHERKALRDWLVEQGGSVDLVNELPGLQVGDAYVWSPSWLRVFKRVRVRQKLTLDASSTPRVGEKRVMRDLKPLDLGALNRAMAAAVKLAEKADPRAMRRRIAELEQALATALARPVTGPAKTIEVPVVSDAIATKLEKSIARLEAVSADVKTAAQEAGAPFRQVLAALSARRQASAPSSTLPPSAPVARATRVQHGNEHLGEGPERMLAALARVGSHALTPHQLGCLSGYRVTSSTYRTYRSALKARALVDVRGAHVVITEPGLAHVGGEPTDMVTSSAAWRALFREKLNGGPRALFDVLVAHPGHVLSDDELGMAATSPTSPEGYSASSSTYRTYRSVLTTLQLAERVDGGMRLASTPFGA